MLHQVQCFSVKLDMNIMTKIEGISRYVVQQCPATREDQKIVRMICLGQEIRNRGLTNKK
jgi:hypothetical protein